MFQDELNRGLNDYEYSQEYRIQLQHIFPM